MKIQLNVNGQAHTLDVPENMPLLWALRDFLGLKGTKYGCGIGACGACTVHLDGEATRSCSIPASAVQDSEVTTIEALTSSAVTALRDAWLAHEVSQCGYCQSGQLMSAAALLAQKANLTDADIEAEMSGNLCRCGTYPRIKAAIKTASQALKAEALTDG